MKVFISYKFAGEDKGELRKKLEIVSSVFEKFGHRTFIFSRDRQNWGDNGLSLGQIITMAFNEITNSDLVLAFVDSDEKSEGMLLELGYAIASNKPIWLAINNTLDGQYLRFVRILASKTFCFSNQLDLINQLTMELTRPNSL